MATEYKETTFTYLDGSVIKVHTPILTPEEREKRKRQLIEATKQIMRCVILNEEMDKA